MSPLLAAIKAHVATVLQGQGKLTSGSVADLMWSLGKVTLHAHHSVLDECLLIYILSPSSLISSVAGAQLGASMQQADLRPLLFQLLARFCEAEDPSPREVREKRGRIQ